jgi:putrescine importer
LDSPIALERRLTPFSVALFGLSYICPTAIFSTFGILQIEARGATASAYLIATLAVLLTAVSYGRMAARYPQAGSAYTFVSRTVSNPAGFIVGWVLLLDYALVPMAICLFTAKALEVILPGTSYTIWVAVIALSTTLINVLGIKVADRVNLTIMAAQLAVIAAAIGLCVYYVAIKAGPEAWSIAPLINPQTTISALMGGAAIAAYSFLGFDAVTTLSEETINPTSSIPRATVLAAGISGMIYIGLGFLMGLVHPSTEYHDVDKAGYEILAAVSGRVFFLLFIVIMIAWVASVMCAQAGSSRLLYVMGRDRALPAALAYVHPRFKTPVFNIGLIGLVMLVGERIDVGTAASCVNFGAFTAFLAVNLCVVVDQLRDRRGQVGGAFRILPAAAGAATTLWLIVSLQRNALIVGSIWLAVGLIYLRFWPRQPLRA